MNGFRFLGVRIDEVNYEDVRKTIIENVKGKGYICVNCVHTLIEGTRDKTVFDAIENSLLSIPDGMPLVWFGKLSGSRRVERIPGPELMKRFFDEESGYKHYLLGDTEETITRLIEKARRRNPQIEIVGHSPPFRRQFSEEENKIIVVKINHEDPDIIWVSFGFGKQDKWMSQNISGLKRGVMIGVGAAFRCYLGDIKVPPKIFQKLGLHWFFVMLQHPIEWIQSAFFRFGKFIIYFPLEVGRERMKLKKSRNGLGSDAA